MIIKVNERTELNFQEMKQNIRKKFEKKLVYQVESVDSMGGGAHRWFLYLRAIKLLDKKK